MNWLVNLLVYWFLNWNIVVAIVVDVEFAINNSNKLLIMASEFPYNQDQSRVTQGKGIRSLDCPSMHY